MHVVLFVFVRLNVQFGYTAVCKYKFSFYMYPSLSGQLHYRLFCVFS